MLHDLQCTLVTTVVTATLGKVIRIRGDSRLATVDGTTCDWPAIRSQQRGCVSDRTHTHFASFAQSHDMLFNRCTVRTHYERLCIRLPPERVERFPHSDAQ